MSDYLVTWTIDAENVADPIAAARHVLAIMQQRNSSAVVFEVRDLDTGERVEVDLLFNPPAIESLEAQI